MNLGREGAAGLADRIVEAAGRASCGDEFDRKRAAARIGSRRLARIGAVSALGLAVVGTSGWVLLPPLLDASGGASPSPIASSGSRPDDGSSDYDSWWGTCETRPLSAYPAGPTDTFSLTNDLPPGTTVEEGANLEMIATLTALVDADVWTRGIDIAFLFDDQVVGVAKSKDILQIHTYSAASSTNVPLSIPILACDGLTPLWPGDYEVVVSQGYDTEVGHDADGGAASAPRVTAEPVPFTIAGDRSENPLYQEPAPLPYEDTTVLVPAFPENALTAEDLHQLIEEGATDAPWDMAPGTSRWTIPSTSASNVSIYGPCWFGGMPIEEFPEMSADLGLLQIEADFPERVDLLFGWVIEGPPTIPIKVTNLTDSHLPDPFFSGIDVFLVQGRDIMAQGRLEDISPWWGVMDVSLIPTQDFMPDPAEYYGLLLPHETVSLTTVWMTTTPCTAVPQNVEFPSGTYTVLVGVEGYDYDPSLGYVDMPVTMWVSLGTIEVT